jgi:hypothetical protein
VETTDDYAAPEDVAGRALVVIAESTELDAGGAVRTGAGATVNLEKGSWENHGLASVEPSSTTTASLFVEDPAHPVAASLEGTVTVHELAAEGGLRQRCQLGADAQREVVAVDAANTGRNVAFAYEAGARTVAGAAPARRAGLGL